MPFEIVRNDIVNMQVDAFVDTAKYDTTILDGDNVGFSRKICIQLFNMGKKINNVGEATITTVLDSDEKFVINTVVPVWQGGQKNEETLLKSCYEKSLKLALKNGCKSIAFPVLSTENGFPKSIALEVAINMLSKFTRNHKIHIYLVIPEEDTLFISKKLFNSVQRYIGEKYIADNSNEENKSDLRVENLKQICKILNAERKRTKQLRVLDFAGFGLVATIEKPVVHGELKELLDKTDAGFSETLLKLIDKTGKKDSYIYKKAHVDRKLFSKIRSNPDYKPSKETALAFALALELDLDDTRDFIARAGFALSHSIKQDIIIEHCITTRKYDLIEISEILCEHGQDSLRL